MKPIISIITPIFNNSELIKQTISSVINQSINDWEMIIVDDGSDNIHFEKVEQFVFKFDKIKLIKRTRKPKGPSTCRNIGVEHARGKYLIFLDSDDLFADFCLEERVKTMGNDPKLDFAVFNQELFNTIPGDLSIVYNKYAATSFNYLKLFLENNNPWTVSCPIWKKDFFLKIRRFNEAYLFMEDPELHVRALLQKDVYFFVNKDGQVDSFYRQDVWNIEKKSFFWANSIKYRIKFLKRMYELVQTQDKINRKKLILSLNIFLTNLIKHFMIARIKIYRSEYFKIIEWAYQNKIIPLYRLFILKQIGVIWLNENILLKKLKLKGITNKLFL